MSEKAMVGRSLRLILQFFCIVCISFSFISFSLYLPRNVVDNVIESKLLTNTPTRGPNGTWRGVTVVPAARRPCFVTRCPKAGVSDFTHWDICHSVKSVVDIAMIGEEHILPTATKRQGFDTRRMQFFARPVGSGDAAGSAAGGVPFGQRNETEVTEDADCAVDTALRWRFESCVDPRYPLSLPLSVHKSVAGALDVCYSGNDVVCNNIGRHGTWEWGLHNLLRSAAMTMTLIRRKQFDTYRTALLAYRGIKALPRGPQPKDVTGPFGVEYYDIGGNVGFHAIHMQRWGFPTKVFEATPLNMQLLSTSKCLNGLRPSFFGPNGTSREVHLVAGNRGTSLEPSGLGMGDEDPFRLFHVALGDVPDQRCVIVGHSSNISNTSIKCSKADVENTAADAFGTYERRGFVVMTTMDRVLHYTADDAAMCARFGRPLEHSSPQRHGAVAELHKAADTAAAGRESGHAEGPAPKLPEDFISRDYIVKIDIEGSELKAMSGARKWLTAAHRPRMLVSEVGGLTDITAYGQLMLEHGYVGVDPVNNTVLAAVPDFTRFHRGLPTGFVGSVYFVERRYAEILLPNTFH